LTLDGEDVAGLFDDDEVEAHGMRAAIAIAVTSAAVLVPAGHAATTQSIGTAATTQRAGVAATAQVRTEATTQVAHAAVAAQVVGVQARLATSKTANLKAYKILRYGLVR